MTTRVLIADDEALARSRLRGMLEELNDYEIVAEANNGSEALHQCMASSPDIVLLDIRMPDMDGIEAARHMAALEEAPAVIFTTAFDSYAIEAFDTHAIGYLLKPVRMEKLERALAFAAKLTQPGIDAATAQIGEQSARTNICARRGADLHLIPIDDVQYFQADQKYITVKHLHGEDLIDEPLKDLAT
ncbi:MAG: DNA-binding response regulator, partial [Gammaproteobacteria bacterium]|nr:DNA-binding response regulator [Gammaproteobacteria bacterium]